MANPFQDQLLKAGVVTKDKVNKANKSKHKQAKQQAKNAVTDAELRKREIAQAEKLKAERDRELNRLKVEEENKKAVVAQIKQLVEMNRLASGEGETAYNFADDNKIKTVYVSDEVRKQIINGRLAIARVDGRYEIVPKAVADKIRQRDASFIVLINDSSPGSDEDDEYADFKVPDDLMW